MTYISFIKNKKTLKILLIVVLLGWIYYLIYPYIFVDDIEDVVEVKTDTDYIELKDELIAKSAIVYDIEEDKILFGKNIKGTFPIASITKLTSVLVANHYLEETDRSSLKSEDIALPDHNYLSVDEQWFSKDLLEYSLISSSNRGINAVVRTIEEKISMPFVQLMNNFIRDRGILSTHFVNATGLDVHDGLEGSSGSVEDIAKILDIFLMEAPELASATTFGTKDFTTISGRKYTAKNTNSDIDITNQLLLSKTGYTDIAGGTLAVVIKVDFENTIAVIVLGSTRYGRFQDIQTLITLTKEHLNL